MPEPNDLPIHFFTIVLNGQPFIRYHLAQLQALTCRWHWHIVEGLADLKHDTAWSLPFGARVPDEAASHGRSIDGTAEYLDRIAAENPDRITLYRSPEGRLWNGKLEMVGAPVANLREECLLWQLDSDELWTTAQFHHLRQLFLDNPNRQAASFYCWYFVGPARGGLVINRRRQYPEIEWRRAWRYKPGMLWAAHEPPVLAAPTGKPNEYRDVALDHPFTCKETEVEGLTFQHFAYVTPEQLAFKEKYYGCQGITGEWQRLQEWREFPVPLKRFFNWPWVHPGALVEPAARCDITPLAAQRNGEWQFSTAPDAAVSTLDDVLPAPNRGVLYIKWGNQYQQMLERSIASLRAIHPELPIHIQELPANSSLLDKSRMFDFSPFDETLYLDVDTVVLDRLDFGFDMARKYRLACAICECPWARRYAGIPADVVEYNTGVLFFSRDARALFNRWAALSRQIDSSSKFLTDGKVFIMPQNDQASFAVAVAELAEPPFILPMNWNVRPKWQRDWFGPIKIWHDYSSPPVDVVEFSRQQSLPSAILQSVHLA